MNEKRKFYVNICIRIRLKIIIYSVHETKRLAVETSACKFIVVKTSICMFLIMFMSKFGIQGS
jgi:hypothetical protein